MLTILSPNSYAEERKYVFSVIFNEFLGLEYSLQMSPEHTSVEIQLEEQVLSIKDLFFQTPKEQWARPESLPELPLKQWEVREDLQISMATLPILFGRKQSTWLEKTNPKKTTLGLDVFGSVFFLLTRYEETIPFEADSHTRFSATQSIAAKANFLHRPLVDEYVEVLWAILKEINPRLERKQREYRFTVTHDVDRPFIRKNGFYNHLKSSIGDILFRRNLSLGIRRLLAYSATDRVAYTDPFNTFDWIMDQSEKRQIQSEFYFLNFRDSNNLEGDYDLRHPWIKGLIKKMGERGHKIGIHTSYASFEEPQRVQQETEGLRSLLRTLQIEQKELGGRQHYLRWENPKTWRAWNNAKLDYDSTLSFHDLPGFRTGTCHEYPVFDLETRQVLELRERPLIAMEGTLYDYMSLSNKELLAEIEKLSTECKKVNGNFVLLWHNNSLLSRAQRKTYQAALDIGNS